MPLPGMEDRASRSNASMNVGPSRDGVLDADWDFAATGPLIDLSPPDDHPLFQTQSSLPPVRRPARPPVERISVDNTPPSNLWHYPPRPRRDAMVHRNMEEVSPDARLLAYMAGASSLTDADEDPMNPSYRLGERQSVNSREPIHPSPFEVRRHFLSNAASATPGVSIELRELDYVQPFDQNLLCPICQCPFVAPVRLSCDHIFCMECIGTALEDRYGRSPSCPSCRQEARIVDIEVVPKLIQNMLDDMMVRCPLASKGCSATITRGAVKNHVSKYCHYHDIECPDSKCLRKVPRKWAADGQCHHGLVVCENCQDHFMEYVLSEHQAVSCAAQRASCPDCHVEFLQAELSTHRASCSEALVTCSAVIHGCKFSSKADQLGAHQATCPIRMMSPFLETQKARLNEHETALRQLQHQNATYRASIAYMQGILGLNDSLNPYTSPGTSNSPVHLLATLREEVNRVSNAIESLDAKTSMLILNEARRHKDDMAYTNGALSNVRMQLQWLMSMRQPSQIASRGRMALNRSQNPGGAGPSVPREVDDPGSSSGRGGGGLGQTVRSLSDSTRQDPKL